MKYGFGVIGTGSIAEVHARSIHAIDNLVLVGAYDVVRERAEAFGQKYACKAFYNIDAFLNMPDLNVVCICTPSGAHLEPALKAIEAGKHCVIEKPLEVTLERCDKIIAAAKEKQVTIAGIFPSRFQDASIELKSAVDEQRFGRMVMGDAYIKWYRSQQYYDAVKWRGTWKLDGGGALMNQGIHSIDLLQWYMGPVESVSAFTGMLGHKGLEVEDTAVATLKFASGAMGVIEGSTAVYPGFFKKIEILGTQGSAVLEENNFLCWKFLQERETDQDIRKRFSGEHASGGGVSDPKAISDLGHIRQLQDMIYALERKRLPLVDAVEARKAVEIIVAIYQSARTGETVNLPL